MTRIGSFLCFALLLAACGPVQKNSEAPPPNRNVAEGAGGQPPGGTPKDTEGMAATTACYGVDSGKKAVLKSQTFAIDFAPFKGSCFVTTHDPEYKDPPLESEIAIYRDGKNVFTFPDQFNGVQVGCWVEAVSFQDVNSDQLTDVVVVGKCSGKSDSFNENTVYVNNGKSFITRQDVNYRLADFKTVKEISGYLKENPRYFSSNADASNSNSQP